MSGQSPQGDFQLMLAHKNAAKLVVIFSLRMELSTKMTGRQCSMMLGTAIPAFTIQTLAEDASFRSSCGTVSAYPCPRKLRISY
jgi:hypothetical protein